MSGRTILQGAAAVLAGLSVPAATHAALHAVSWSFAPGTRDILFATYAAPAAMPTIAVLSVFAALRLRRPWAVAGTALYLASWTGLCLLNAEAAQERPTAVAETREDPSPLASRRLTVVGDLDRDVRRALLASGRVDGIVEIRAAPGIKRSVWETRLATGEACANPALATGGSCLVARELQRPPGQGLVVSVERTHHETRGTFTLAESGSVRTVSWTNRPARILSFLPVPFDRFPPLSAFSPSRPETWGDAGIGMTHDPVRGPRDIDLARMVRAVYGEATGPAR
jgi:hypothetical protein